MTVGEKAYYVRSKNAGPFWVTIDIFCKTDDDFLAFKNSASLTPEVIANIYDVPVEALKIFYLPDLKVMKISYPRKTPQGDKMERDMHSGQQYVQMMDVSL